MCAHLKMGIQFYYFIVKHPNITQASRIMLSKKKTHTLEDAISQISLKLRNQLGIDDHFFLTTQDGDQLDEDTWELFTEDEENVFNIHFNLKNNNRRNNDMNGNKNQNSNNSQNNLNMNNGNSGGYKNNSNSNMDLSIASPSAASQHSAFSQASLPILPDLPSNTSTVKTGNRQPSSNIVNIPNNNNNNNMNGNFNINRNNGNNNVNNNNSNDSVVHISTDNKAHAHRDSFRDLVNLV